MAYKVRAVVLGASGKAEMVLDRWELKAVTLAQAKAEFDARRWSTGDVQPTAFEILEGDAVLLRRPPLRRALSLELWPRFARGAQSRVALRRSTSSRTLEVVNRDRGTSQPSLSFEGRHRNVSRKGARAPCRS